MRKPGASSTSRASWDEQSFGFFTMGCSKRNGEGQLPWAARGAHGTLEKPSIPFLLSSLHHQCSAPLSLTHRADYFRTGKRKEQQQPADRWLLVAEPRQAGHPRSQTGTSQRLSQKACHSQRAQLASYINDLRATPLRPPDQAADAPRQNPPRPEQTSPNQHVGFFPRRSWGTQ